MTRSISTDFSNQLTSSTVRPFYAVSIAFSPNKLNIWTGYNDVFIDSETYVGTGNLLEISEIEETSEVKANGIRLTLSGIDSSILSEVLTEDSHGTVVELFFGVLTQTDNRTVIVETPYKIFEGILDTMTIRELGETSLITVTVENKMVTLERPIARRYTDQDQKISFPTDKGLEFVDDLQDKSLVWGGGSR